MKLKVLITVMMLGLAMPAVADFETIAEAYEVALSEIRLPRTETGTIAFKPCSTCDVTTKRVDAQTRWLINGEAVPLREFREALEEVADPAKEAVSVLHHLERDRVTAVSVYL